VWKRKLKYLAMITVQKDGDDAVGRREGTGKMSNGNGNGIVRQRMRKINNTTEV